MKNRNIKFKIATLTLSTFYLLFFIFYFTNAQTRPQFLVSWQAQNYAPAWYQGKILPVSGTPVSISFELVDNGKIADLSKTTIRWYVNDNLVINENNGLGIKNLKINIPYNSGGQTEIRIVALDYLAGGMIDKIIEIPAVNPEVVIGVPYPNREIKVGVSTFNLIPFFFSINDLNNLSVGWLMNGQKPKTTDNPYIFNLNVGSDMLSGARVDISASVKNNLKDSESANKNIQLQIK